MNQKFALISVYDKTGIVDFAKVLAKCGYTIISTGGTWEALKKDGVDAIPIEKVTGNPPDSFDGRMKTISFQIEGGILFDRKNPQHVKEAKKMGIPQIDIVVCNLYPFEDRPGIETIDVGGPTMIRAAAKNYQNVTVLVDPQDYQKVGSALINNQVDDQLRKELAAKAFYHLSFYDSQIGRFFSGPNMPDTFTIPLKKITDLRYGENPHQTGALFMEPKTNSPLAHLKKLWGRRLSGTNIGDIHAGLETVRQFKNPAACVIKHLSPCGIALGEDSFQALSKAIEADPVSAFGGVIVTNQLMDVKTAQVVAKFKTESEGNIDIIAVPEISQEALEFLKRIRKSMGIYVFGQIPQRREKWDIKYFSGVSLLQDFDDLSDEDTSKWQVVTTKKPTKKELALMKFGLKAVKAVRSNAVIVIDANYPMTRGIGSGQTSRVGATKIALEQAGKFAKGGILISDSFFPFDDSVRLAGKYGVSAILQQGGSINDNISIEAANELGIAMVFSQRRAFRH